MVDISPPPEGEEKKNLTEKFKNYASSSTEDIISYVVLILGILFLFFNPWVGGALIGVIFGIYFAQEIIGFFKNINAFIENEGMVRSLVLLGTLIGIFILSPTLFIAAAIGVGIKEILVAIRGKKE